MLFLPSKRVTNLKSVRLWTYIIRLQSVFCQNGALRGIFTDIALCTDTDCKKLGAVFNEKRSAVVRITAGEKTDNKVSVVGIHNNYFNNSSILMASTRSSRNNIYM
jgi:hypothetical protein